MLEWDKALKRAKDWARQVGRMQMDYFRKGGLAYNTKVSRADLVTEVDEESEKILMEAIGKAYPHHGVLSEEYGDYQGEAEYTWVIDPLDGTTNYFQGIPIFALSLALQHKKETVLGVIYNPALGEMFEAVKGKGAYLEGGEGRPLEVSSRAELGDCVLATGFPYDKGTHPQNNINYFSHLVPRIRGVRRMGAAAVDLAYVAAGFLDGFWELNLKAWDVEAGNLMIREAGGKIIDLPEDREVSQVAGNPVICEKIYQELKKVGGYP